MPERARTRTVRYGKVWHLYGMGLLLYGTARYVFVRYGTRRYCISAVCYGTVWYNIRAVFVCYRTWEIVLAEEASCDAQPFPTQA